jgi:nucleoside-diphosphate-sugar epimerase
MKVFVAGATGGLGRRLVPILVASGHQVVAMTRDRDKARLVRDLGATPVVADGLDRAAVMAAVLGAEPEIVIHQMTALLGVKSFRKFDEGFAQTNRLRTEGLDYLLEAARTASARRFVAQSFGNWNYERTGSTPKTEDDPLDPHPPARMSETMNAIRYLENALAVSDDIEGIALRYGNFYGPGAHIGEGGPFIDQVRRRKLPIIGNGAGVWSFTHVDDAATATILAMDRGEPGVYNIADDEPPPLPSGCPSSPWPLKPSRHGGFRPGLAASWEASQASRCSPRSGALRMQRPSASWAGN